MKRKKKGVEDSSLGICYTRTGRPFFEENSLEKQLLDRLREALTKSRMWEEFKTDWICLDCELMPWSAKAQVLIKDQYAAVGISGQVALSQAVDMLKKASERGIDLGPLVDHYSERNVMLNSYVEAYRRYCWPVHTLDDFKLAPFHILATEGQVHINKDHLWHLNTIAKFSESDNLFMVTNHRIVDVNDPSSVDEGIKWWEELTGRGGEGMVVKPLEFIIRGKKDLAQPAVKCRGKEYLRIIYGPEYTLPENLERLRQRGLGKKRALALREFALGIEALERFISHEPLYKVHECVFGVLALESEPVDPRL